MDHWDDNRLIYVSEIVGGNFSAGSSWSDLDHSSIPRFLTRPSSAFPPPSADGFDHSLSTTADRSLFVFHASSFDHPPEIYWRAYR